MQTTIYILIASNPNPGWIQGFPREDSIGERIAKGEKQRLDLTGLLRKPIKPVTSGLH